MAGPPSGPTRPARSSAPRKRLRRWGCPEASAEASVRSFPAAALVTPPPAPPAAVCRASETASERAVIHACMVAELSASRIKAPRAGSLSPGLGWNTKTRLPANLSVRPNSARLASVSRTRTLESVRTVASPRGWCWLAGPSLEK